MRIDYWDEDTAGFGLRVSEHGRKSWIVMYWHHRQLRRMTLGTYPAIGLADARLRAKEVLLGAAQGKDPARHKQEERNAETFDDLMTEYIEKHAQKNKKSWEMDQRVLKKDFLPALKGLKAKDITRKDVLRILDTISERGSLIMANRSLEVVRKMFNFAVESGVTAVYDRHSYDSEKRDALEKWGQRLTAILTNPRTHSISPISSQEYSSSH